MSLNLNYPVTESQKRTAARHGWIALRNGRWSAPESLTDHDRSRIEAAQRKRDARGRSAD